MALPVVGEPTPSPAGNIDSMTIGELGEGVTYYFCVKAYDLTGNYSPMSNSPMITSGDSIPCEYTPGDFDADGLIGIFDVSALISFLYMEGDPPEIYNAGDTDGSGDINLQDIAYLLRYLYFEGPEPVCIF